MEPFRGVPLPHRRRGVRVPAAEIISSALSQVRRPVDNARATSHAWALNHKSLVNFRHRVPELCPWMPRVFPPWIVFVGRVFLPLARPAQDRPNFSSFPDLIPSIGHFPSEAIPQGWLVLAMGYVVRSFAFLFLLCSLT